MKKKLCGLLLMCSLGFVAAMGKGEARDVVLWYDSPARNWNEALPVGNGRLGAMVFGGALQEQIQFNDNTLYSGEPSVAFKDIHVTPAQRDEVVRLMRAGEFVQASSWSARTGWAVCTSITSPSATCISGSGAGRWTTTVASFI